MFADEAGTELVPSILPSLVDSFDVGLLVVGLVVVFEDTKDSELSGIDECLLTFFFEVVVQPLIVKATSATKRPNSFLFILQLYTLLFIL